SEEEREYVYRFPPLSLLDRAKAKSGAAAEDELRSTASRLVSTLQSFGVSTKVVDYSRGPTVTRYELQPDAGVRLSRIVNLADDLALNLAAEGVRIEAPIPGKAALGIEVPNKITETVRLRSVIQSPEFKEAASPLAFSLGQDLSGRVRIGDISKMPHLLIAGATGMGKSVCINSIIISLVYKASPDDVQLVLIDPKLVEFTCYAGLPHLHTPVVTDPKKASGALAAAVREMERRYKAFAALSARNIGEYNAAVEKLEQEGGEQEAEAAEHSVKPRIVIIIDELNDLMMTAPNEVEDSICRLAQMGRAAGIHLVVATQRPSVDVITGTIKNNIPTRIAFRVSSQVDSRTILDSSGAEKLIGNGDMLFLPVGATKPIRIQGCYVSEAEVSRVVGYLKKNGEATYNEEFIRETEANAARSDSHSAADSGEDGDPALEQAIELVVAAGQASTSLLQRKLKLGYARAARIMDDMEEMGVVGPADGSRPREVRMTRQQYQERLMSASSEASEPHA
ncbi:MAG: DNA translocase FtsK, partial [Oscillospiraceae bacterium]|nr:DNA translocase FtsK [Oscillospiraceae bacterium]